MATDKQLIMNALHLIAKGNSYRFACRETGIAIKTIRRYQAILEKEGESAITRRGNRYYQPAEKVAAVLKIKNGFRVSVVAAEMGATEHSVRKWEKIYDIGGPDALKDKRFRQNRNCTKV